MADMSRRSAIAAVACLPPALLGGAAADPLLSLISACRAGNEAYNAVPRDVDDDLAIASTYGPFYAALASAPAATTRAGALAALRFLHKELEHTNIDAAPAILSAALAYFDGAR
ncbi:hypothetical protein ACLBXM_19875 [Xanthobacteraceae bacterium A53D]